MCYSAQIQADYGRYVKTFGAQMDIREFAPVLVVEDGQYVVKPMRYQCRIVGKPTNYDFKYPGTYNARRDSLDKFWKPCFNYTHALLLVDVFYENVTRAKCENTLFEEHDG